ncbi:MAG: divalent-cation tolerance protein CutA [Armatimonadota bacterium]
MWEYVQVQTTAESRQQAEMIAQRLVSAELAACVQVIGPLTSIYRWEGEVTRAEEWLCLAKTTAAHLPQVEAAITQVHSYQVPEIIALPIIAGSEAYLDWLAQSVGE